jgi:Rieske Fe-S protein
VAERNPNSIPPDGRPYSEQPQWRNDFPIDWPQDEFVARRDFTKFLVLTSFAFVVGQAWILFQNWSRKRRRLPPIQKIARVDDIPVGAVRVFTYPEEHDNCLLIRTAPDRFLAYNQKCTHLGCAVTPTEGGLHCPCHEGWFDMATGRPTAGPPRRPLPKIALEIRDGVLYATGVEVHPS